MTATSIPNPVAIAAFVFGLSQVGLAAILALRLTRQPRRLFWREFALLAAAASGALWVVHPYLHDGQIGAGDSYHYGLQVADFVTQLRAGVFPVMVGQSEYALNGNIHTVRTAPYFTLFAGLLDLLTLRQLSFFALQNLAAVLSFTGAALSAVLCTRFLAPSQQILAAAVGFLYAASPALAAALYASDMFATVMAAPWIPLFFTGIVLSLQSLNDARGLLLAIPSLGLVWYAHPAIGAWLTVPLVGVQVWRFLVLAGAPGNARRPWAAAAWLGILLAYLLYSVSSLRLDYHAVHSDGDAVASLLRSIQSSFPDALLPLNLVSGEGSFQLGYSLTVLVVVGLAVLWHHGAVGKGLAAIVGFIIIATCPVPGVTAWFWESMPSKLVDVTNVWPAQRFYLIFSGLAVVSVAAAARIAPVQVGRRSAISGFILAGLCLWSAREITKFHERVGDSTAGPTESAERLRPENAVLTRSSYLMFGRQPPAFSHGWIDPSFELNLRDASMARISSNSQFLLDRAASLQVLAPLRRIEGVVSLVIPANRSVLLRFEFADSSTPGEIKLLGDGIRRNYLLPASGGPRAFGSSPSASHTLTIDRVADRARTVEVSSTLAGVAFEALEFEPNSLPLQVASLTPFNATVVSEVDGFVETSIVLVPGYRATVNGVEVPVERSPDGLIAIRVAKGKNHVAITYPGPPFLREIWFVSLGAFLITPWIVAKYGRTADTRSFEPDDFRRNHLLATWRRLAVPSRRIILGATCTAAATATAAVWHFNRESMLSEFGSIRLTVELPQSGAPEPLIITGKTGAADCLYVVHEGNGTIRLGFDHWGVGGPLSEPIQLQSSRYHTIELTHGGLFPPHHPEYPRFARWVKAGSKGPVGPLRLVIDGRVVWDVMHPFHPAAAHEVSLGVNSIGASACGPRFTGQIIQSERFMPDFFR